MCVSGFLFHVCLCINGDSTIKKWHINHLKAGRRLTNGGSRRISKNRYSVNIFLVYLYWFLGIISIVSVI